MSILKQANNLFDKVKGMVSPGSSAEPSTPPSDKLDGLLKLRLLHGHKNVAGLCKVLYNIKLEKMPAEILPALEAKIYDSAQNLLGRLLVHHEYEEEQRWFAINTHNLENGEHTFICKVCVNDQVQFESELSLSINNAGDLAERVSKSLQDFGSPTIISEDCNSTLFNYADQSLTPWFDKADAQSRLDEKASSSEFVEKHKDKLSGFLNDGFMVLEGWLDDKFIQALNNDIDDAVNKKVQGYEIGSSQRIMGLHSSHKHIKQLWEYPKVLEMLSHIFEDNVRPCQTLTYVYGSQQSYHQDTVHLTPFPAGYMCGVWVALEDIKVGSGELRVLKGSHRLPRIYRDSVDCPQVIDNQWDTFAKTVDLKWQDMIAGDKFEEMSYLAKKGDILIWHENLMHGGSLRENLEQSRRSIVSHYFAKGALGYYDSSGVPAILQ